MVVLLLASMVAGSCIIVLLPRSRAAMLVKYGIYLGLAVGMLFVSAMIFGQYIANAPL